MYQSGATKWCFALAQLAVAAAVNTAWAGFYNLGNHRIHSIGPGGTTTVFVLLAIIFLAHAAWSGRRGGAAAARPLPTMAAYCGASAAWLAMMGHTAFVHSHPLFLKVTSTLGIAAMLSPLVYVPYLVLGYMGGAITVWLLRKVIFRRRIA